MAFRLRGWILNNIGKRNMSNVSTIGDQEQRLADLRKCFDKHNIGVYVVLTQDEHNSEYTSEADNRRAFISGFTGSAGTAVISKSEAVLATDGRYFLQAGKELGPQWQLLKQGVKGVPTWQEWAANEAARSGANIGVDPKLITYNDVKTLKDHLAKRGASGKLLAVEENLVDVVWGDSRPHRSDAPAFALSDKVTGKNFTEKVEELQKTLDGLSADAIVVSALDEVAWLFNLRGTDIPYNPVFFAYASVTADGKATLYIDDNKVTEKVREHLGNNVALKPYDGVFNDAKELGLKLETSNADRRPADYHKIVAPNGSSWALVSALGGPDNVRMVRSPVEDAKAIKNEMEVTGAKLAHDRDGVALVRYLAWLEKQVLSPDYKESEKKLSDYEAGQQCLEFRKQMEGFVGLSFETISASGANAAVIHYAPPKDSDAYVTASEVYLLDSGGQYKEGTTDTTRTVHYGVPSDEEVRAYTLVLKGHVALARAVFPEGSNGYMLDTLARQHLWRNGLDYRHGTGHGIGAYLNVHEGPVGIGFRQGYREAPLAPGHIISNEPGYYEDGKFGIRIESVVVVREAKTPANFGGTKFLEFETITKVPFCRKLIDTTLLDSEEIKWINQYHTDVYNTVKSYLSEDDPALDWLTRETAAL